MVPRKEQNKMFSSFVSYDAIDGESRMGSGIEFQTYCADTLEARLPMDVLVGGWTRSDLSRWPQQTFS